jgi:hypothetical protein
MPPVRDTKNRWREFVHCLEKIKGDSRLLKAPINPKKILAVCVHPGESFILTGESRQMFYESAIEVASLLTLANPALHREMIPDDDQKE